jgi:hypothetical protein
MQVRLTRKLAECIDGVDLTCRQVGDILNLPVHDAHLLIAEAWAEVYIAEVPRPGVLPILPETVTFASGRRAMVGDLSCRVLRSLERLRQDRMGQGQRRLAQLDRRRAEDAYREELRDSRARTVVASASR